MTEQEGRHDRARRSGSSPAPAAAWAPTSRRRPWPPAMRWSPPAATRKRSPSAVGENEDLLAVRWTSPTPPPRPPPSRPPWTGSAGSTSWSTTPATSTPASSRKSPRQDFRAQIETTMFGPMNVTRAALPVLRAQRSGLVVTISSTAGIAGGEFLTAYAASKFGVEGWAESLAPEVAPFGIRTMIVEPGFFRTELLTPESTSYAASTINDYAERTEQTVTAWKGMNGQQGGDPAKLAAALIQLAELDEPPLRFAAGADAVGSVRDQGQGTPGPGRSPPRTLQQPRPRRRLTPPIGAGRVPERRGRRPTDAMSIPMATHVASACPKTASRRSSIAELWACPRRRPEPTPKGKEHEERTPRRPRGLPHRPRRHDHGRHLHHARAPSTTPSRSAPSTAPSTSASPTSTPPRSTARSSARRSSDRPSRAAATRSKIATKFGLVSHSGGGPGVIDSSAANVKAAVEGSLQAPRHRPHRPVLPAPRRPEHAHRGDRRRRRRSDRRGQGAALRALRGVAGDHPPRPRRAAGRGTADRVLAVDPRRGGGDPAAAARTRHRIRARTPRSATAC